MWQLCYLVTHEWQCKSFGMFETLILYFRVEEHFFCSVAFPDLKKFSYNKITLIDRLFQIVGADSVLCRGSYE